MFVVLFWIENSIIAGYTVITARSWIANKYHEQATYRPDTVRARKWQPHNKNQIYYKGGIRNEEFKYRYQNLGQKKYKYDS